MHFDEDNKIELKEIVNNTLPKEIVAFLNTEGGAIFIGVNKDGNIVGVKDIDDSMETCKKVCVFDSAPALGLCNMSKPNVALSSSVNS